MDRVVNIYSDGRLVYTGSLELAARRLNVTPDILEHTLDNGPAEFAEFRKAQPRYNVVDGFEYQIQRARKYIARWRD